MKIHFFMPVLFFLTTYPVLAADQRRQEQTNAYSHQKLAREFIDQKQWVKARSEAKLSTLAAPDALKNRDAWLLLATLEERFGNFSDAKYAYSKYLMFSPTPEKRDAVTLRLTDLEPKVARYNRYKWGSNSSGIIFGSSPQFQTYVQEQLGSEMKSASDYGLRFGSFSFGYKSAKGTVGQFKIPTTTANNSPYVNVPAGGTHIMDALFVQNDFRLGDDTDTKLVVWSIPIYYAWVTNAVKAPSGTSYKNFEQDLGIGLRVDFYTKSFISFDVGALYHVGIPSTNISPNENSNAIKNLKNEIITGSTSGVEVRIGMKILFSTTPPEED